MRTTGSGAATNRRVEALEGGHGDTVNRPAARVSAAILRIAPGYGPAIQEVLAVFVESSDTHFWRFVLKKARIANANMFTKRNCPI